ncbi:right-handed parallel beta-helix repeat-containing protein [Psychroserpens sp.]|uniref:right-handed parallel beta-helix repeat-containing protein n=1 Tax=Psychroserpens sp. TaxID=2020870 RepID=UPI001B20F876|nr:right-handed parallel beta-helix repeat-containing protein [Psychroserpens sp.]MBO6606760.1 right-handed parallel beta-helix repeat-containing protein [Psychroserpens sp.]MBO6653463.1 right-handed parallel beta-helix repeat-containing protein [Psychroserpens sp.]MBO6680509.1 right-handed parallel beta-helix repeat-containing protein [Psychroserpens sp.]MBO6750532.1 right-handed parallel beta-helix repeat-containing protein [Psychroserpens sp.]MBO6915015.1 right-handed parallel beta-helix re
MKRLLYFFLTLSFILLWSSCRKDFDFAPSTGNLEFSRDTVYLDTVFTNIGSSTYNLKVYNRSDDDISIPTVRLGQGQASNYRLNVDGMPGKEFQNVELLANDSLFIFVETTADIQELSMNSLEFLYTDAIEFDSGSNQQKVELVTLIKDAVFIYPDRDETTGIVETLTFDVDGDGTPDETTLQGRFLEDDELTFTNEKPYVIYGYAAVDEGDVLNVDAGARVHFHANSGLLVTANGSLKVNGALSTDQELLENEVIFEGDRLEPLFADIPGQWGTIWLFNDSADNDINFATIKNATVGILCEGNQDAGEPKLSISNSQIYNSSNFGILARASSVTAENVVLNNSGQSSFAGTYGGRYNFTHCTIANYWSNFGRQFPSLLLNNFITDENNMDVSNDLVEANFNNCIIFGNDNPEVILDQSANTSFDFNFKFTNCLIRFQNTNNFFTGDNYNFGNSDLYDDCLFNDDPDFEDPFENLMRIGNNSAAIDAADDIFALQAPVDLLNASRTANPDIGAYQHTTFDED